jgi:hypothetical protein
MLVYGDKGVKQRSNRRLGADRREINVEKMLIDREKMLVLPFRKSRSEVAFCLESIGKERKSLQP